MSGGIGAENVGNVDRNSGKVKSTEGEAGDRHKNVIDERVDNGCESAPDGDTNSEINHVSAVDKFAKFFEKSTFFLFFGHDGIILAKDRGDVKK